MQRKITIASIVAVAAGLSACAGYGPNTYPVSSTTTTTVVPVASVQPAGYVEYGRITNVSMVQEAAPHAGVNSAAGTVVGGVVGGALGSLVGAGSGRVVATVLGAAAGAVMGNHAARNYNTPNAVYRVSITTDQGALRDFDVSAASDLRVGDRVRIENGVIYQG